MNISCTLDEPDEYDEFFYEENMGKDWMYNKIKTYISEQKNKFNN